MKIAFHKVHNLDIPFEVTTDLATCKGVLSMKQKNLAKLEGVLEADLALSCDLCGEDVNIHYNEPLNIQISDGTYSNSNDDLDIIESLDGFINLDEIVDSEINMIKSDYYYCNECK